MPSPILLALVVLAAGGILLLVLRTPRRRYEGPASVSQVYDDWTTERFLECYWADHLHAGHYGRPPGRKDFVAAKTDMVEELIRYGISEANPALARRLEGRGAAAGTGVRILDVGSGIGGSARQMAQRWPATAHVTGITLSNAQVARATSIACTQGVSNVAFFTCDAQRLAFADETFDVVWAVESECHMPDKAQFVREMVRVLKPGGSLVIAAWNLRETDRAPLSRAERHHVQFLLDEWCHTNFISIRDYVSLFRANGLDGVDAENWTTATQPTWRHGVLMPLMNPGRLLRTRVTRYWGIVRDAYTLLRFDSAFRKGLCEYGVIRGRKPEGRPGASA
jgi:MPBQ/MSBQ methyltransferase